MKLSVGLAFTWSLFLCTRALGAPTVTSTDITIDENTANGTVIGQVFAVNGASTTTLQLDVGKQTVSHWSTRGDSNETINFGSAFTAPPIVYSQLQSYGNYNIYYKYYSDTKIIPGYDVLFLPRQHNTSTTGFETILDTDLHIGGSSVVTSIDKVGNESLGWLAISQAVQGTWSGKPFEALLTDSQVTDADTMVYFTGPFYAKPQLLASLATRNDTGRAGVSITSLSGSNTKIWVDELSDDDHNAEAVSLMMLQGSGELTDVNGNLIGETGSMVIADTNRNGASTISLLNNYNNPIVFVRAVGISEEIYDTSYRFTNISSNSFTGYLHEDDETHFSGMFDDITLNYVVLEAGSWTIGVENYTYSIADGNDSGAFVIDSATGRIKVADSSQLDFESGVTQFTLTVQVVDGTGQTGTATVNITLNNVQDSLNSDTQAIYGLASNDWTGWASAPAGDVNGDGLDDIIVGAPESDINGNNVGRAYVVFGNSSGVLADLDSVVAGNGGFVINGASPGDKAGFAVAGGGDINGDGLDDLVVGAPYADPNGSESGAVYVIFGKADTSAVELAALALDSDSSGFAIYGAYANDHAGGTLVLGDVNGDGLADITLSEIHRKSNSISFTITSTHSDKNMAYTVYGKPDGLAVNLVDIVSDTNPAGFVVIDSVRNIIDGWSFGAQVLPVGDFNTDGLTDFIINDGLYRGGMNTLVFGRTGGEAIEYDRIADDGYGLNIEPETGNYTSIKNGGIYLSELPSFITSPVGDVNADGLDDIALLLTNAGCCVSLSAPRAYVVFGTTHKNTINLEDIAAGNGGFIIEVDADGTLFGSTSVNLGAIGGAGDINGDGYDDLVIGDLAADAGNGRLYAIYGKSDTSTIYLSNIVAGSGGFFTSGNAGDALGHWITRAGDINGDGISDVVFGAPHADPNNIDNAGAFYVMLGKGNAVSQWGTSGDDTLTGVTNSADTLVGAAGNDSLMGNGGADVLYGGPGDDIITVSDNDFLRIDGGRGTDTVKFEGAGIVVNVATSGARMRSIEIFDINGSGANTLHFNKSVTGTNKIIIKGGADDTVYSTNQQWSDTLTTESAEGITYKVYSAGSVVLWLRSVLSLTTNSQPTISAQSFSVDEYSKGGSLLGTINASANDIGDAISYSVISGNEAGFFSVDTNTGELTIANSVNRLDYESGASYALTVQVTDLYGAYAQATITITVNNLSTITHTVAMDASGGGSIWAGWDSLLSVLGESTTVGQTNSFDFANIPGLPIDSSFMDLSMQGVLQMQTAVEVSGGTVEATLPVEFSVSYPDEVQPGGRIEIITSLAFAEGAKFTASSPAFNAWATGSLLNYDFVVGTQIPQMISSQLSGYNGEFSGNETSKTVSVNSTSTSVTSTQSATNNLRLEAAIALPGWVDQELSFPSKWSSDWDLKLTDKKEGCKEDALGPYGGHDLYYYMEYELLDPKVHAVADLFQDFSVELNPVAVLTLEDGTQYSFDPRANLIYTPETSQDINHDGIIDATLSVSLNPVFANDTQFYTYLTLPFKGGKVEYKFKDAVCTYYNGQWTGQVVFDNVNGVLNKSDSVGSLIDEQFTMTVTDNNGDPNWVNQTFSYTLSDITYTEQLSFDLCDGEGTACADALNNPPAASGSSISGTLQQGQTLTGSYSYSDSDDDAESGSVYQWNLASDASGTGSTIISGATAISYIAADEDSGKYLQFCVTPSDAEDKGSQNCSNWNFILGERDASLIAGFAQALALDGTTQYARIPLNSAFNPATTSFTIESWIKVSALSSDNQLIMQQLDSSGTGRSILGVRSSGQLFTYLGASNLDTSTAVTLDTWYHVAVTYDQATSMLSLYLNGELENQHVRTMDSTLGDIVVGINKAMNGNYFNGALDETRIWTEVRSKTQIQQDLGLSVASSESNLLLQYTYDQDNGVFAKDATGNYNADLYNSPSYIYTTEHAANFDGQGDYVEIADAADLAFGNGSFSAEAWVYADAASIGDYRNILCKKLNTGTDAGWLLRLNNNMHLQFFMANGSKKVTITDSNTFEFNRWHHVAISIDRSTQTGRLYLDGQEVASNSSSNVTNANSSAALRIGTWSLNGNDPWVGSIDAVRLWSSALTQTEIESNMYARFNTVPSNLMADYTFEDNGANNLVEDISGNNHSGTIGGDTNINHRGISVATRVSQTVSGVLPGGPEIIMYRLDTGPLQGTLNIDESRGEFNYTPNPGAVGSDSFTYYVINSKGDYSYSEIVNITIE